MEVMDTLDIDLEVGSAPIRDGDGNPIVDSTTSVSVSVPIPTNDTENSSYKTTKVQIIEELETLGCCSLCVQRYLGINDPSVYRKTRESTLCLSNRLQNENNIDNHHDHANGGGISCPKLQKKNACIVCLGLLQIGVEEDWMARIVSEVQGKYLDAVSVCLNVSMPTCAQLRAYSLWYHLQKKFPEFYSLIDTFKPEGINMKAVWKWVTSSQLQQRINPNSEWNSNGLLSIQVNTKYKADETECSLLFNHLLKQRKGQKRKSDIVNRTSVDLTCSKMSFDDLSKIFRSPPPIPTVSIEIGSIVCQHAPIFVAGRYCKYSRTLSQTPWVIDGVRKTETSVEELMSSHVIAHFQCDDTRFSSSGREDVDVRCLGKGRPFVFELINPRKTVASNESLRQIQEKINSSTSDIYVRDLQIVDKKDLSILKDGEETKSKHYSALCAFPEGINVTQETLDTLNSYPVPITLMQNTPVRVLHRRSASCRKRTIFQMTATPIANDHNESFSNLFRLCVKTQAGTYVKEFVHGDLGRTVPSVSSILGLETDILLLDVESVDVDWPKELPVPV